VFEPTPLPILLYEPDFLYRRTVALTARDMHLGEITETSQIEAAAVLLQREMFRGLVICIDEQTDAALSLIDRLRAGETASDPAIPVVTMVSRCDDALLALLLRRNPARIVIKPIRARTLLEALAELGSGAVWRERAAERS
jgi:DNA-binding NarL/FixJ family response regulator